MKVELVDWMGTDLTVVNAARVSYAKTKTEFSPQDEKLIKYLAEITANYHGTRIDWHARPDTDESVECQCSNKK